MEAIRAPLPTALVGLIGLTLLSSLGPVQADANSATKDDSIDSTPRARARA